MMPFLADKKKSIADVATSERAPDEDKQEHSDGIMAAAQDLINAVHAKDAKAVASALKAAHELADMELHTEGPHTNE